MRVFRWLWYQEMATAFLTALELIWSSTSWKQSFTKIFQFILLSLHSATIKYEKKCINKSLRKDYFFLYDLFLYAFSRIFNIKVLLTYAKSRKEDTVIGADLKKQYTFSSIKIISIFFSEQIRIHWQNLGSAQNL